MSAGAVKPDATRALGRMVVGSLMSTAARRFRDREAMLCAGTGRRFTFLEVNARCNRLAHGLAGLGLRKGEVVAFLCNNRAELRRYTSPSRSSASSAFR
jgi:acyl-CoA synthetase (AMP-forming)/AMP-acid ligase II